MDLRSGNTLWRGEGQSSTKWARASPVMWQHSSVTDASHSVSGSALQDMLSPQSKHCIAYGPRSPQYRP